MNSDKTVTFFSDSYFIIETFLRGRLKASANPATALN